MLTACQQGWHQGLLLVQQSVGMRSSREAIVAGAGVAAVQEGSLQQQQQQQLPPLFLWRLWQQLVLA
jgi:hypothetical protein